MYSTNHSHITYTGFLSTTGYFDYYIIFITFNLETFQIITLLTAIHSYKDYLLSKLFLGIKSECLQVNNQTICKPIGYSILVDKFVKLQKRLRKREAAIRYLDIRRLLTLKREAPQFFFL